MSPGLSSTADPPPRWGLTVKLFGALLLLSGLAVLASSVLGYVRARDALEEVSGRRTSDDVLAHVFEKFCVGK